VKSSTFDFLAPWRSDEALDRNFT